MVVKILNVCSSRRPVVVLVVNVVVAVVEVVVMVDVVWY